MMIVFALFVLATIWIPLMLAFLIIDGLNEGVVYTRSRDPNDTYGAYSRTENPFFFWTLIVMYGAVVLAFCYIYITVGSQIYYGG
jgi:hypothetical protein